MNVHADNDAPAPTPDPTPTPTPEPTPTNLTASASASGITLSWTAPDASGVTGYQVMRRLSADGWVRSEAVHVDDTGDTATGYTDADVEAGEEYHYRVKAWYGSDLGRWSNGVNIQAASDAPEPTPTPTPTADDEGVCDRTQQVQDVIVGAISGVETCGEVTGTQLSAIGGTLRFSGARLTSLRSGDFDGLSSVAGLDFSNGVTDFWFDSHNRLATLPAGIFDDMTALGTLNFARNRELTALPENVFDNNVNLHGLWLVGNKLTALPPGVFDNLSKLRSLPISHNRLAELPEGVFDNLRELGELYINDNRLTALPEGVFAQNAKLYWLKMQNNSLTALPASNLIGSLPSKCRPLADGCRPDGGMSLSLPRAVLSSPRGSKCCGISPS